jgi:hypothetical protein
MGVHPQLSFLVLEADRLISLSPIFRVTLGTPQNKSLYMLPPPDKEAKFLLAPLYTLYIWKLDCVQTIWDKMEVLFGTSRGTLWAWWEHIGNITKQKNALHPTPTSPKTQKKETKPRGCMQSLLVDCAWNFYFQNSLSSFSTWATTLIINLGVLIMRWK